MALVRRLNSLFSRSIGLVVRNTVQYVGSNWKNVSKESKSFLMICTAEGNSRPHCCFSVKKAARAAVSLEKVFILARVCRCFYGATLYQKPVSQEVSAQL